MKNLTKSVLAVSFVVIGGAPAEAQQRADELPAASPAARRVVTLVLTEAMNRRDDAASVQRSVGRGAEIVIRVRSTSLSPELVATALRSARKLVRDHGDAAVEIHIPKSLQLARLAELEQARMAEIIGRLHTAPIADHRGVGRARALTIELDPR